jgi:cholecystokinin A receptor
MGDHLRRIDLDNRTDVFTLPMASSPQAAHDDRPPLALMALAPAPLTPGAAADRANRSYYDYTMSSVAPISSLSSSHYTVTLLSPNGIVSAPNSDVNVKWQPVNVGHDIIELPMVRYCLIILHVVGIVLGAVGNGLLIYSMLRHRKRMRSNVTAYLILNLVVCQTVCTTVYQPMRLTDILLPAAVAAGSGSGGTLYCQISGFFASFFSCVSFHTIVAISQERLVLICLPLWAKRVLTVRNTRLLLAAIWTVALGATLPLPLHFTLPMKLGLEHTDVTFCIVDVFTKRSSGRVYFTALFCLYYALPVITVSLTYCKIFATLYRHGPRPTRLLQGGGGEESASRLLRSRRSLAKRMLLIAAIFTLCQGPYYVTFLLICTGVQVQRHSPVFVLVIVEFLPVIGYVLNPLVYYSPQRGFHRIALRSIISHEATANDTLLRTGGGVERELFSSHGVHGQRQRSGRNHLSHPRTRLTLISPEAGEPRRQPLE